MSPPRQSTDPSLALREWAVTCDALARGEQVLLLREAELLESRESLDRRRAFWLYPSWGDQRLADVTDPYRDRLRRLRRLHRDDGRLRLRYSATIEYLERLRSLDRLLALDGEHTLNSRAVEERLLAGRPGLWLLMLRIYERAETAMLEEQSDYLRGSPWVSLREAPSTAGLRPVLEEGPFVAEKARLLQRSGSIEAV